MTYIRMSNIQIYHPATSFQCESYLPHFDRKGIDIRNLLTSMNKESMYRSVDVKETSITMATEAALKALNCGGFSMDDIDMIVFSTQLPEYSVPTNAVMLHRALNGSSKTRVLDLNASCAGMTVAVEQISHYMLGNPRAQRVLLVGSEQLSAFSNPDDAMAYATFGDAACAVILEKTDIPSGFIDAEYHTYTGNADALLYPRHGFSQTQANEPERMYLKTTPFDISFAVPITDRIINTLLERNEVAIGDIDAFCFSQMAYQDTKGLQERFSLDWDKIIYVGDQYGYTGTTSPFLALYHGIESEKIKRGDTVLFWTVGAGHQFIAMLFTY